MLQARPVNPVKRRRHALVIALSVLLAIMLVVIISSEEPHVTSPNDLPTGIAWKKTFEDEFVGSVSTTNWNLDRFGDPTANEEPYNPSKEAAYYNSSQVTDDGTHAVISMKAVQPWIGINGKYYGHVSGVMTTSGKESFGPGDFVQASIQVPKGDGLWPAFWSVSQDGSWGPEFDFFEFFNTGSDTRPYFSVLSTNNVWDGPTQYGDWGANYVGHWHVYGMLWQKDGTLIPYIDGKAYPQFAKHTDTTKRQFLILNMALQEGFTPPANPKMLIDWVRFYTPKS